MPTLLDLVFIVAFLIAIFFGSYAYFRLPVSPDAEFFSSILIGHRGAMGDKTDHVAENSISAAKYAFEKGAQGVEMDIMLSKDQHPIVFHDPIFTDRVCKPLNDQIKLDMQQGEIPVQRISSMTLSEIKRYEFVKGPTHERIPTLYEYIDGINDELLYKNKVVMIEVKEFSTKGAKAIVGKIQDVFFRNKHLYNCSVVASFNPLVLYFVRKADPNIITLLITKKGALEAFSKEHIKVSTAPEWVKSILTKSVYVLDYFFFLSCTTWLLAFLGVGVISFEHNHIKSDYEEIKKFQKRGYQVNVWTVNDVKEREELMNLGVAVTTDWF
ncbi:glycerophosphodiester phosphodiesterase [Acrasis kona]|uniref:Glycerophosphodiester phosphodiesterase n=1 Tax=Acrasis kona TaxID=1008807 RepID=A0AAW2YJF3_9EUKA